MNTEIWKDIKGYEGLYQVSNFGRVKSLPRTIISQNHFNFFQKTIKEKILSAPKSAGYPIVTLYKNGVSKIYKVHRLVTETFIPNPNNLSQVNHKDEDKTNNCVENLEWCDSKYNVNYGTRNKRIGEKQSIPVFQYSADGKLIKCWKSASEVQRITGMSQSFITTTCNGKHKLAYGYKWSY